MRNRLSLGPYTTPLSVVAAIVVVFAASTGDIFLSTGNLGNVARQIAIDAPLVFAQTIALIAGGLDLSVGSTMAMSAVLAIGLQPHGAVVACLGAVLFGLAAGSLNGFLVARARINAFIATLGTMSVTNGIMLTYTRQQPLSGSIDGFSWWGAGNIAMIPVPFLIATLIALGLGFVLRQTRAGRNLYAVGGDREAAYLAGISVARVQFFAFVSSGLLSALGGILVAARLNSASIQLGNDAPLLTLSAALIGGASLLGGKGTIFGAFLGVVALGMLSNGMNLLGIETYYQIATKAVILVAVVGIDALAGRMARRRFAGPRTAPG